MKRVLKLSICAGLVLGAVACSNTGKSGQQNAGLENLTQYVDPYIGTGDHGHVFMGANVPYGLVQLGPTQYSQGWDWCSGYHISDSTIIGFGHMHLSGTGIGDLGDISFMPAVGEVKLTRGTLPDESTGIYSYFSHDKETAKAGYYAVHLDRFGIDVELTATKRVGFHKYTFPEAKDSKIIIDMEHGIGWDTPVDAMLVQENDSVISGYRYSNGWARDQRIYFTAVFSKPISKFEITDGTEPVKNSKLIRRKMYGQVHFDGTTAGEQVFAKVALSPVSVENAKENMKVELPGWDFEQTIADADKSWNEALSKIMFKTDNTTDLRNFYTAMYHSMIAPSEFSDVNGDYFGSDKQIHKNGNFKNYTTFSLWDTYRAAQPLMTIIHPEMCEDIGKTFLHIFNEQGKLPVWHLMANETDCMVGNPGVIVMADLVLKGHVADKEAAFNAMKASALLDERGLDLLKEYNYIPSDKHNESVAMAMEYAIADWCIAQVAKELNKTEDYEYFLKRGQTYARYFDKETGFVRGVTSKGDFRVPFNPFHSTHREDDYTEGNAWQYTWLVPHDVNGLIDLFGSEEAFVSKLDSLFIVEGDLGAEASPDISGLIGQYAHGNEPSHHVLYLYPFVGQQWKTAEKVRQVCTTLYFDKPAGLSGNEDVGQMSAWYIMSALGFYPMAPAGGDYIFGSPLMNEAVVNVGNGKTLTITAHNNSKDNKYIQSVKLNGQPYTKSYINHKDVVAGGTLEFEMGAEPSKIFGVDKADRPVSVK
ncbi:MAG: GH92 family glycosyl hydrolase [Dysgonomonas sp.]|nr:GH92 family glycosyl hydrolase [Dysgonomonas sp.]